MVPFSPLHVFGWPNDRKAPRCVPPKPLTQKSPWPPSPLLRARAPNPTAPAGPLERPRLPQPGGGLTPPTACYSLPTRQSLLSLPVHGPAQPPPARPPPAHMHRTILGGPAEAHAGGRCTLAGAAPRATDGQLAERGGGGEERQRHRRWVWAVLWAKRFAAGGGWPTVRQTVHVQRGRIVTGNDRSPQQLSSSCAGCPECNVGVPTNFQWAVCVHVLCGVCCMFCVWLRFCVVCVLALKFCWIFRRAGHFLQGI